MVEKSGIETDRLEFEKEKLKFEIALREKEIEIKVNEVKLKELELQQGKVKITPTQVTIIVALLGILSTLVATYIQNNANQELERSKFESEMILKVATSNDIEQNKKNLKWIIEAGLISDLNSKIAKVLKDTSLSFKIEKSVPETRQYQIKGIIRDTKGNPIPNVEINSFDDALPLGRSDTHGEFQFVYQGNHSVKLFFIKAGFKPSKLFVLLNRPSTVLMIILDYSIREF